MSYRFSYDIDSGSAGSDDRSRIRLIFERFGWHATGGSSLRYPAPGKKESADDLFGQVIPALSLFRSLVTAKQINVKAYSWCAYAEADYSQDEGAGCPILPAAELELLPSQHTVSTQTRMSEKRIRKALLAAEQALV
jgi:hypothetical protein